MNKNEAKDFIANYELNEYRYSNFWGGREYEHKAEVNLLHRLFRKYLPDLAVRTIMDLGGAYGRLSPLYERQAKNIILADYSTSELQDGITNIKDSDYQGKYSFLALNAYKIPLKNDSLDALLSVRVMHHLRDINLFWEELGRVLVPGGIAVVEFANKNHIVAVIRNILKGKFFSYLKQDILQVGHQQTSQGMKDGQVSIMYNFSPAHIKKLSRDNNVEIEGMFACSFLRSTLLKRLFPVSLLLAVENVLQLLFGWLLITPSVFIVLRKPGNFVPHNESLQTQLRCPICYGELTSAQQTYNCENKHAFSQAKPGIVDLRDPRPEEVDF